jgi:hypothetical protein
MGPIEIQTLISSLKTASEVTKTIFDMKVSSEVQGKIAEIQGALLTAQNSALAATSAQFELQARVRELETQIKAIEDWGIQQKRYALVSPWGGPAQVYALKETTAEGEKPHFLCTNCFHNSKRVILNPTKKDGWIILACPTCKAAIDTGYLGIGDAEYAERYAKSG